MAERTLPGIGLKGFWTLGFTPYKVDMDANLRILSALVGGAALSTVSADPGAPADGDIHLLAAAHATHPGEVAVRDDGAWVYIPVPVGCIMFDADAAAHKWYDGANWATLSVAGGGGGSGFAPAGAQLDGLADMKINALACTDSPFVAVSYWINYADATAAKAAYPYMNDADNEAGNYTYVINGGGDDGKLKVGFEDEDSFDYHQVIGDAAEPTGAWTHYLILFRGVAGNGHQNEVAVYRNREEVVLTHAHDVFTLTPTFDGKDFHIGSGGFNHAADFGMAEYWFQTGTDLMESDGTISDATLDKFITADLKPVDLGANGETPTGTDAVIYLHRDPADAADTFAVNQGTGGAVVLSDGPLTDPVDNPGD